MAVVYVLTRLITNVSQVSSNFFQVAFLWCTDFFMILSQRVSVIQIVGKKQVPYVPHVMFYFLQSFLAFYVINDLEMAQSSKALVITATPQHGFLLYVSFLYTLEIYDV